MKRIIVLLITAVVVVNYHLVYEETGQAMAFHTADELNNFRSQARTLPNGYNSIFAASGACETCHGPSSIAMQDADRNDVSVVTDWQSTMMALSAKDPFWRAQVSLETLLNPPHQQALETICTRCHAPMGYFAAFHDGQNSYSVAQMESDQIALDGVSCNVCHQMLSDKFGNAFNGDLVIDTTFKIYGQYPAPDSFSMTTWSGYEPVFSTHIQESALCGTCHTLITNSVDTNGQFTGQTFVEQAIYHEWLNSSFPADTTTCNTCHSPPINDLVIQSSQPIGLPGRTPYGRHHYHGGNSFMLKLMKANKDSLGLVPTDVHFDSTINRTKRLLQNKTLDMQLSSIGRNADTARFDLALTNLCGHKFPSGYPSRRAFVTFYVFDDQGDTLFQSGRLKSDYYVNGVNQDYEPHYNVINSPDQVQMYEMVMLNSVGQVTTTLENAFESVKDNRLPPEGFVSTHHSYDTVRIEGDALSDPDFNLTTQGVEGTGADIVHYLIPLDGYNGNLSVEAYVYYQSIPRKWVETMFSHTSPEIDEFKTYYDNADHTPELIASAVILDSTIGCEKVQILASTNMTINTGRLTWDAVPDAHHYEIRGRNINNNTWTILPVAAGSPNYKNVAGLSQDNTYVWQIRSFCDSGSTLISAWSVLDSFTTGCFTPDSIWAGPVSSTAARLNWTLVQGASGYEIKGRRVGTTGFTTLLVPQGIGYKDVWGLLEATTYEWTIRTLCNPNSTNLSGFAPLTSFTTTSSSRTAPGFGTLQIEVEDHCVYPNPSDGKLHLTLASHLNSCSGLVALFDNTGRKVHTHRIVSNEMGAEVNEFSDQPQKSSIELNLGHLSTGIYYLNVTYCDKTFSKKVLLK